MEATLEKSQVVKNGNKYLFMNYGEVILSLDVVTYTLKEKFRKELTKMKYFDPRNGFQRTSLESPKSGDTKGIELYNTERSALATWYPVVMYMKDGTPAEKKELCKKLCGDFLQVDHVPDVFYNKFREILDELSDILTKFKANGG